jgi:hypothetical protein
MDSTRREATARPLELMVVPTVVEVEEVATGTEPRPMEVVEEAAGKAARRHRNVARETGTVHRFDTSLLLLVAHCS